MSVVAAPSVATKAIGRPELMEAELAAQRLVGARDGARPAADGEPMQRAEERLLTGCRAGDPEAFGALYGDYAEAVYRHAYHLLGHREDAHDVRQETFLRAFRALATFRGECS